MALGLVRDNYISSLGEVKQPPRERAVNSVYFENMNGNSREGLREKQVGHKQEMKAREMTKMKGKEDSCFDLVG